ncbi:MAG: hypothetical protein ACJAVN_001788 [Roseivirga sp.]|jgi:hypothetical protein
MIRGLFIFLFISSHLFLSAQVLEKSYLQTDRELYSTQDTLWFKGYVFDEQNKISNKSIALHVVLTDEEGNKVRDKKWPIFDGLVEGSLLTPSKEGKYFLLAFSGQMSGTDIFFKKEVFVRSEIADEIGLTATEITPSEDNESLAIDLEVRLSSREFAQDTELNYSLWSDSSLISTGTSVTDTAGKSRLSFEDLALQDNDYEVVVDVPSKELQKPVRLAIPIKKTKKVIDLQFLPEGGNLINGLKNKIAFKAIDNNGDAVDFEGELRDENGQVLTKVSSFYQGMGHFEIEPVSGKSYAFKITKPSVSESSYALPTAISEGIVLTTRNTENSNQLYLEVKASPGLINEPFKLSVSQQKGVFFEEELKGSGRQFINIPLQKANQGIAKATIYNASGKTLSERLLFLKPNQRLKVELTTDKKEYQPRGEVKVRLKVSDMEGNPVSGGFNLAAIDQTRSGLVDSSTPNMLAQILLNSELKGSIPTPNFYFSDDPRANQALDYVMLTNGWRKYTGSPFSNPEGIDGRLIQRKRRKKVIANTTLKLYSVDGLVENDINVDEFGEFAIPSAYLKAKGDSFLLATSASDKEFSPNIRLLDSTKILNNGYKKELMNSLALKGNKPDLTVFKASNKVQLDKFQEVTILNSFTITERNFFGNACDALALDTEGNWSTKTAEQLDMSKLDLVTLLRQVSDKVLGYGPVATRRVSYDMKLPFFRNITPGNSWVNGLINDAISVGAILSPYKDRLTIRFKLSERSYYRPLILEWPIPFDVYINCEYVEPNQNRQNRFPYEYYEYEDFETIDLRNLESISVNAPSTAGRTDKIIPNSEYMSIIPRPIIVIKTIGGEIIRKQRFYPYYFYTTYQKEQSSFYAPAYTTEKQINSPVYDLRNTIHWETDIITDQNGEATVSFFNADRANTIGITVEGIDSYSRMGFATGNYKVVIEEEDKRN